ncbi:MAG: response regulator [Deltaproteobacteria bacterium]|nr:response regulator [Deltaproteobacteria bacterium]
MTSRKRVLVADDEETTRLILHSTLVHWGYDVTVCEDGEEAYRLLNQEGSPDVALLDWMMPGMDGVSLCRELRKRERTANKYLILLTTRTEKEDLVQGLQSGADDYVTKPFDMRELKERLLVGQRTASFSPRQESPGSVHPRPMGLSRVSPSK